MKLPNIFLAVLAVASLGLAACDFPEPNVTNKDAQAQKAAAAAASIQFTENAEIENIKRRLELTSNPGQIGFILLLNEMGQPVAYMSVRGKVTSGSKRLTQPQVVKCLDLSGSTGCQWTVTDGPSDEGTYGSSTPYIFFWTTEDQYIQWSGKYLYSDKPLRTSVPALVVETKAAADKPASP
jgi:hypothetical protein